MLTFQEIENKCQPHRFLSKDWHSYSPTDFAQTFLPNVSQIVATAMYVFDGADVFYDMEKSPRAVYRLYNDNKVVTFYCYIYPKTVLAAQHKESVRPDKYDCCMFVELINKEQVEISYKFGEHMFKFVREQQGSYVKAREAESTIVSMTIHDFRAFFLTSIS